MPQLSERREDGILVATIANPPHGTMDGGTTAELIGLLSRVEADDTVRVLVLMGGVDGVFIQHYSVNELAAISDVLRDAPPATGGDGGVHPLNQLCARIEALDRPVIAALNGNAMGGGFELAMACDLRIVESGPYTYGLPEVHVGLLPGAGGTQRLARLVGVPRALEMIMRGRVVGPEEALSLGMAQELAASAADRAMEIAAELAGMSPRALCHIKRLVRGSAPPVDPEMLALETGLFMELMRSDTGNELMKRLNEGEITIEGDKSS